MSARVCGRCRRPLPVPASGGSAPTSCPFCFAHLEGGRDPGGAQAVAPARPAQPRSASTLPVTTPPPVQGPEGFEESPGKKRAEAFASALAENAGRTTPVHTFAVPPEAIPVVTPRRRGSTPRPPQTSALPPVQAASPIHAPPAAAQVAFRPPVQVAAPLAPIYAQPVAAVAPPRRAAVTATLASLGPSIGPAASAHPVPAVRPSGPAPALVAPALVAVATVAPHDPARASAHSSHSPSSFPAPSASRPEPAAEVAPVADAWNIGPYLGGGDGAPSQPPEAIPDPQPHMASEPIDLEMRGPIASLIHRLPGRGIGAALGSALIVVVLGAGGFKLFGGALFSRTSHSHAAPASPAPAATPADPAPLPTLIMPRTAAEPPPAPALTPPEAKAGRPSRPEPRAAPPAPEEEPPGARSSTRTHARHEKEAKPHAPRAKHHASSSPVRSGSHHSVVARSSKPERGDAAESESDRMARARAAYREGNERLFSGDGAGAIAAYDEMVRLNPKDPAGYRGLGLASAQLGKRTDAVRYLRAYLKHAPNAEDRTIISGRISLLQTLP